MADVIAEVMQRDPKIQIKPDWRSEDEEWPRDSVQSNREGGSGGSKNTFFRCSVISMGIAIPSMNEFISIIKMRHQVYPQFLIAHDARQ